MKAGQRVRIKSAPDRIGILTDDIQVIAGKSRWLVQFAEGSQRFPEGNLEAVDDQETIETHIQKGNFGKALNLRTAITHARLTGRLADIIYSMDATNTEFYAYQFKPVLNFLDSPCNGILIADEVGLGKTIEAGLIWTELRARVDANRLLVLCPAILRDKWVSELNHRFGIASQICNASELLDTLKKYSHQRGRGFAVVCSLQGIRPPKGWEEDDSLVSAASKLARFLEQESAENGLFDCIVVDEAHYLRNTESQSHKLVKLMRPVANHMVLLSATPIQLKSEDLFNLLNIIDPENFAYKRSFDDVITANEPLIYLASQLRAGKIDQRKLLENVRRCLSHNLLCNSRQLQSIVETPPSNELLQQVDYRIRLANQIERINLLGSVISRTRKRDVHTNRVVRSPFAPIIEMNGIEREFYDAVTQAVRRHCQSYDLFDGFLLTIPQRQMCSSMPAALRAWTKKACLSDAKSILSEIESVSDDDSILSFYESKERSTGPLMQMLAGLSKTIASYDQMRAADSKYRKLLELVNDYWRENPTGKIILFSFYRETLNYLHERLDEDKIKSCLIMGGMGTERDSILKIFEDVSGPNILLSTEVLSEGVDLQFSSALINYDLPWNPMRVEQRVGRIDRIGQKQSRILIWNFFYADSLDDRVYRRLFERLNIFEHALGDMEAVLGDQIRSLTYELLSHNLTPAEEEERISQTTAAIANIRQHQEQLESQAASLAAHGDYVLNRVTAAKELNRFIDGLSLWAYVRDFLLKNYPGSNLVKISDRPFRVDIDLSIQAKADLKRLIENESTFPWTELAYSPIGKSVKCIFSNQVDFSSRSYEVINQGHALVRFAARNIKQSDIHPLASVEISALEAGILESGRFLIVVKRWSTSGAKTIERLVYRAVNIDTKNLTSNKFAEKLVNGMAIYGRDWISASSNIIPEVLAECYYLLEDQLDIEFSDYCKEIELENIDRVNFLISSLSGQMNKQIMARTEAIQKLRTKGNSRMVKLNEAMIRKLEERQAQRVLELELHRKVSSEPRDVIAGVVYVSR